MPWLQLSLKIPAAQVDVAAEALDELGAISVSLEDAAGEIVIETHWDQTPLWSQVQLAALLPEDSDAALITQQLQQRLAPMAPQQIAFARLDDRDWAHAWKANYKPLHIAGRLWICPSWCEPPDANAINLVLDPGLAFGTGTHPTTALCLEWLAQQELRDRTVLDYGCGSGILAIAALKLGARSAIATDLDEQALTVTRENARRNNVAEQLQLLAPAAVPATQTVDCVVANILAGALIELAPTLSGHVRRGGTLALSGILSAQADEVAAHYNSTFALTSQEREGWVRLSGIKQS